MDRGERVEMVVAIYDSADTVRRRDFGTHAERQQPLQHIGSTSVNNKKHRAAEVCLCLLCFLLLIAVIVLCVCFTTERHQLLTYISNLIEERVQVMEHNNNLTQEREQILTKHEQTLNHNNNLTKERQQVFTNNTKLTAEKERLLKENKILTEKREQIKNEINELKRGLLEQGFLDWFEKDTGTMEMDWWRHNDKSVLEISVSAFIWLLCSDHFNRLGR
ncbi:hypothetical protein H4Q32_022604 [Labeo rohita]|uniref:Uncharacterized protein n=1 Tax=Labeo rohita TaxID=84645 RepID=A0ABQ8MCP5_LABRO|nr:hypothetical protein H4Q32_022604 [Labeo rohita]